ncbi:MAG TPA: HEAT repeat domain-containing protein [Chloroflexota bacterium]|nr:HEAT repeat domain-containing protein [Chloroflexota bacterium]
MTPNSDPTNSDRVNRFLQSMVMTFEMWHDGTGYDVDLLKQMTPQERESVEKVLVGHQPRDWRDIEALAMIDSPAARSVIESALKSADPAVRREAMKYAPEKSDPNDREKLIIHAVGTRGLFNGLSETLDEIEEFHTPAIVDALFRGALTGDGDAAVHFAAMLYFLHGKSKEAFDWDHRPFFLRFNTANRDERRAAFKELCETVGVDAEPYMR